jgi:hypothetical protein
MYKIVCDTPGLASDTIMWVFPIVDYGTEKDINLDEIVLGSYMDNSYVHSDSVLVFPFFLITVEF